VRVALLGGVAARHDVPHALVHSPLGVTRHVARWVLRAGMLPSFSDGDHRWLLALFPRLESAAGRKRRGPAKPAPRSIPSPFVRCLVAWVAPSAVLRASAGIVGRRASLTRHPTPRRVQIAAAEKFHTGSSRGTTARGSAKPETLGLAGWRYAIATIQAPTADASTRRSGLLPPAEFETGTLRADGAGLAQPAQKTPDAQTHHPGAGMIYSSFTGLRDASTAGRRADRRATVELSPVEQRTPRSVLRSDVRTS
jgi:hypothetical protein